MFTTVPANRQWSDVGLRTLIGAIIASVLLALADGVMRGPIAIGTAMDQRLVLMLTTWIVDFRYLADQAVYAATIFFVGAKFFETRTMLTVGFDKLDADKLVLKGPDGDNVVWIGRRYGTAMEAESVAAVFAERLKQSAA
jgi:hypothetical protein